MTDTPWTPGPWEIDGDGTEILSLCDGGDKAPWSVGLVSEGAGPGDDRTEANARLIAAAPDMAEALEWYADQMCEGFCADLPQAGTYHASMDEQCAGCKARAALAKAKGATT